MGEAERALRDQLVRLLRGGMAHMTFDQAIEDFPLDRINERAPERRRVVILAADLIVRDSSGASRS